MGKEKELVSGRVFQFAVIAMGLCLWLTAVIDLVMSYGWQEQLIFLALVPLIIVVGRFIHTFALPSGLKFTVERVSFSFSDSLVLLVACWLGPTQAVFLAGIEGFTSARRTSTRLSSNLFSSSMMSIGAAAASAALNMVLRHGFGLAATGRDQGFFAISVALIAASIVLFTVNVLLLSTLLALRHGKPITHYWKDFLSTAPMFMPTGTAASLMYLALQYNLAAMLLICGPVFLAIYFWHRQYHDSVQKRISVMDKAHRETIEALAVAINAKDEVTHEHVLRVQIYAAGVARILNCSSQEIEALKAGALLHDIGKIAVPDYILTKPGKLTASEFEKMKFHTLAGAQILSRVEFPYPVVPVVRHHHERWDGKGYPDGLAGEEIPLTARILSVVDCFDAVREDRQYRKGMSREEAVSLLMRGSGTQYDPQVIGTFIAHLPEFEAEIQAHRNVPVPTFGIEPTEQLSEAARLVTPAAGLAEASENAPAKQDEPIDDEVKTLSHLAQSLIAARSQKEALAAFTTRLKAIVPYDLCMVTLSVPGIGDNQVIHAAGRHAELLLGRNIALGEGVTGWVIANRKSFCNTDPKLDLPPTMVEQFAELQTLAVFPVASGASLYGAITLYSTLAEYTAQHERLIEESAALLATALSTLAEVKPARLTAQLNGKRVIPISHSSPLTLIEIPPEYKFTQ